MSPWWKRTAPCSPSAPVIEGQPSVLEETVPAGVAAIKAPAAWDASRGKAIKVAVLDTGIDPAHPDLGRQPADGMSFVSTARPAPTTSTGTAPIGRDRRRRPRPDGRGRGGPCRRPLPGQGARPQRPGAVEQPHRRDRLVHQRPGHPDPQHEPGWPVGAPPLWSRCVPWRGNGVACWWPPPATTVARSGTPPCGNRWWRSRRSTGWE